MRMTSGWRWSASATASSPFAASPTTRMSLYCVVPTEALSDQGMIVGHDDTDLQIGFAIWRLGTAMVPVQSRFSRALFVFYHEFRPIAVKPTKWAGIFPRKPTYGTPHRVFPRVHFYEMVRFEPTGAAPRGRNRLPSIIFHEKAGIKL